VVGAGGIGQALAAGLWGAGAAIVATDASPEAAQRSVADLGTPDQPALAMPLDIRDKAAVDATADAILGRLGRLDVLVNAAGITQRGASVDFPQDVWQRIVEVNLSGAFYTCQAAGRHMLARGGGSIVNVTSIAGEVGIPTSPAYSASKGGLANLTRVLALEWAEHGVRVNAIAPGWVRTPMGSRALAPEYYPSTIGQVPMGRIAEPDELVGPVLLLASDAASFVTGAVLPVDGGFLAR
jgi:NAD(P)-dependent dehydrogenase (short-subunit alcohol dehydrogenase family)